MRVKILALLLLPFAAIATPATANWFAYSSLGVNLNIGSAPNPTPAQLRQERLGPLAVRKKDKAFQTVGEVSPQSNQGNAIPLPQKKPIPGPKPLPEWLILGANASPETIVGAQARVTARPKCFCHGQSGHGVTALELATPSLRAPR